MKSTILILVFGFLGIGIQLKAQEDPGRIASENRMHHDIAILASDSLKGREAGTNNERMAADYIAKRMQAIGLMPKGDHEGSYLSEFRMNYPVIFKEAKLRISDMDFRHPEEFGATDLSSVGSVSARLINIGKGTTALGRQNYTDEDIKGKIVVLDIAGRKKKEDNSDVLENIIVRVKSVVSQGAVGVILHNSSRLSTENLLFGSPFTESLDIPVVYMARLPYNRIHKLKDVNCSLSVQLDRTVSKPENVIGWIDNHSAKTVVVGAHCDHVGITRSRTGADKTPQIHNGADDNASGTAALLELAAWTVNTKGLKYNYIFVAFSAEEKGLFGSKAFCSRKWVNHDNIAYMLNMDMVGRLGCQGDTISILGMASSPDWDRLVGQVEHPDFSIRRINGAPPFSDHAPFLKKGIPVIYFTTGLHPDYHTPKDDTELINFKGMGEIMVYIQKVILKTETLPEVPFHKINFIQHAIALAKTF